MFVQRSVMMYFVILTHYALYLVFKYQFAIKTMQFLIYYKVHARTHARTQRAIKKQETVLPKDQILRKLKGQMKCNIRPFTQIWGRAID